MRLHVNETSTYDETLSASVRAQDPLARQAIEIAQLRAKISNYERESEHWSRDECRAAKAEIRAAIHDMKSLHEHTMAQELQTTKNQLDVSQLLVNKLRENLEESRGAVAKLLMEKQDVENELRSTRVQQLSTDFTIQQLTERTSMLSQTHDTSEARCRSLEAENERFKSELRDRDGLASQQLGQQLHDLVAKLQPVADIHAENQQLKAERAELREDLARARSESDSLREETANAREDARRSRQDIHKMQTMDDKLCEQRANVADLIMAESEVVLKECMVDLSSELAKYKAMTATTARATESQAESASDVFLTHLQRGVPRFDCFKDLFRPFEAHTIIGLRRLAGCIDMHFVRRDRFMWHLCPETGYFIAPEHTLPVNVQVPYKDDPLPHAPRKRTIELFCQPLSFGAVWYTGRYEVGNAETMQSDEYKLLPEEIQQYVVEKTSSSLSHSALQDKYLGGQMTALRYPVRRVGYMAGFDHLKTSQTL